MNDTQETDILRIAYFLSCVLDCGIRILDLPPWLEKLRTTNSVRGDECQHQIFKVAFEVLRLDLLLNKVIFVDDFNLLLPQKIPCHIFINRFWSIIPELPEDEDSPFQISPHGKQIICTSEWLHLYYTLPLSRYSAAWMYESSRLSSGMSNSWNSDAAVVQASVVTPRNIYSIRQKLGENDTDSEMSIETQEQDDLSQIPMAVAIPLETPVSSGPANPAVTLFAPGQFVKLCGLGHSTMMNEKFAVVSHQSQNRLLVRIPGDPRLYSVKPKNLVILEGSVSPEMVDKL